MTPLRAVLSVGCALALTGCGMLSTGSQASSAPPTVAAQSSVAARSLLHADDVARDGKPGAAQELYLKIQQEFPQDPAAPQALYRLGVLQADPVNPLKDYRAARTTFSRLLAEYPQSPWDADARAWQATLTDLLLREDESRRMAQRLRKAEDELLRTRKGLERLRQSDLESERRP